MRDGLYRVMFQTQYGRGSGVIHAQGGKMWGGDGTMFFVGTYTETEGGIAASVKVDRHTKKPMSRSIFGVDRVSITISGQAAETSANAEAYRFTGTAAEIPSISLTGMLERISD
jgi:hypothetical protein